MAALQILIIAVLVVFILLCLVYLRAFYSPMPGQGNIYDIPSSSFYAPCRDTMVDLIRRLDGYSFEDVWITSHDGLKLYGRYYHHADGAPLDIAFHGYRGTAVRDMCGGFQVSRTAGHNVLLVDQRAHGRSAGHSIAFGLKERYDCLSWVNYARGRFGSDIKIMLYGVSMGAATVLMASCLDLKGNVRGIIADCPYSSPKEIICKVCRDMHLPPRLVYPLISLSARMFGGFNPAETSTAECAGKSDIPILILHGEADLFVPPEMSKIIADAQPGIERYTFSGAAHGISGIVHMESYNQIVLNFINRCCE